MKAFSINVRFDLPQAGAIPIAAPDKDEAIRRANELFKFCRNVEIIDAVEVPLSALLDNMDVRGFATDAVEEAVIVEEPSNDKVN